MKALGTAGDEGHSWRDFEIVISRSGRPEIVLHGEAATRAKALGVRVLHISLSHSRSSAGAVAVVESSQTNRSRMARRSSNLVQGTTK